MVAPFIDLSRPVLTVDGNLGHKTNTELSLLQMVSEAPVEKCARSTLQLWDPAQETPGSLVPHTPGLESSLALKKGCLNSDVL